MRTKNINQNSYYGWQSKSFSLGMAQQAVLTRATHQSTPYMIQGHTVLTITESAWIIVNGRELVILISTDKIAGSCFPAPHIPSTPTSYIIISYMKRIMHKYVASWERITSTIYITLPAIASSLSLLLASFSRLTLDLHRVSSFTPQSHSDCATLTVTVYV